MNMAAKLAHSVYLVQPADVFNSNDYQGQDVHCYQIYANSTTHLQ